MTTELRVAEAVAPATVVLEARGLTKSYHGGDGSTLPILDGLDLEVRRGEMVAIVGASGAGKSTLLHLLGALDRPTSGEILLAGEPLGGAPTASSPPCGTGRSASSSSSTICCASSRRWRT